METYRLKQFCLIVETGSLTTAAKLLNVTHSSLSKSMKVLQQELDRNLLQPSGRGLSVTEQGHEIYKAAKEMLETENRLFSSHTAIHGTSVKMGSPEIFLGGLSDALCAGLFHDSSATLLDLEPGELEKRIGDRQIDFGVTYAPYPSELVEIAEIGRYRVGCFHLEGSFKGLPLNELPFVVPAQGLSNNPLGIKERDGWLESLHPRNKVYAVNLLSTGLDMTLAGACAIYIPTFVARRINAARGSGGKLVEFALPRDVKKSFHTAYAIRSRGRPEDRDFKKFCSVIRKMIQGD